MLLILSSRSPLRVAMLTLAFGLLLNSANAADQPKLSFSRDIKPILSNRCFTCHGPDADERKADLRLDVAEGSVGTVIKAGSPEASEMIARITSKDPETMMPPASSKKPALSADEIALLTRWIREGAEYDAHWAYKKIAKVEAPSPAVPADYNTIDRFLLAELESHGLKFSPMADKRTLLRRVTFDVIGLPPTSEEIAAFETDNSPQAYEKVVDRLLSSPHYGERMAMYWLDVVRFADSAGYHSDNHRDLAPYRDYVINAFNSNKPFDVFTREQLAGDLLPNATAEQKIASGYNKLLQTTEEGGAQPKEYTAKYAADRVRNTSVTWLASTMACCECHNHKFDPFTIKDFYSLGAFFADVKEAAVGRQEQAKIPLGPQEQQLQAMDQQIAAVSKTLQTLTPDLEKEQRVWEQATLQSIQTGPKSWLTTKPEKAESAEGQTLTVQDDLSVIAGGKNPAKDTYNITLALPEGKVTGLKLETLVDASFPNKGLARGNGNFVLTGVELFLQGPAGEPMPLKIGAAAADFEQATYPIAHTLDGNPATGWAVSGHEKPANHEAVFTLAEPITATANSKLIVRLKHESQFASHNIGKLRLSFTAADKPTVGDGGLPASIAAALAKPLDQRTDAEKQELTKPFLTTTPLLANERTELAKLEADKKALSDSIPATLITVAVEPRMMRVLSRGNWQDDSGIEVKPAVPSFLASSTTGEKRQTRLDLANWMTSPENPLVSRVFVNRLWKLCFGRGIVKTAEDFGAQGELPTHPALLDYLSNEFIASGWNIKQLHKEMLMSAGYRQTSIVDPSLREKDPNNQWFSRQNRFRLDAEVVRDNALAVSGLLSKKLGGPSVKPYQPAGYWQYLNFPVREWANDKGENQYRRGLYTYWQRTFLHPSLAAFDAPSREECTVDRSRSNTPQQALVLLNDPTYVESARVLAALVVSSGSADTPARLEFAFRRVLSRAPRPEEVKVLTELLAKHQKEFAADPESAKKLLAVGDAPAPAGDAGELAAWTSVCRVLLNLHETITRN